MGGRVLSLWIMIRTNVFSRGVIGMDCRFFLWRWARRESSRKGDCCDGGFDATRLGRIGCIC